MHLPRSLTWGWPVRSDDRLSRRASTSLGSTVVRPRLIVVLPGGGYGPQGPALRFPVLALEQLGPFETIVVAYPTVPTGAADASAMLTAAVVEQVLPAIQGAPTATVIFVAKSLGTRALAGICAQLPNDRTMSAIWLTPLFGVPEIRDRAATSGLRSLIVAGSVDPYHDPAGLDAVASALAASTLVVPNADHALEVRGDVLGTLHAMHSLTRAVLEFAA